MTVKTIRSQKSTRKQIRSGLVQNKAFVKTVRDFYKEQGRHQLPWRKTTNPYRILVSEVMLQQTQVERVISYYKAFLKRFPTVKALAQAPLTDVLVCWQGLGYNRRAKMLHEAAQVIVANHGGRMPHSYDELVALPGVGDYTAKAVRVFAYNQPEVMIETNIRTVFIHHFLSKKKQATDRMVLQLIEAVLDRKNPRAWYAALMDYGSHLKRTLPNPSRKSAHYTKQKPFKDSDREIRGAILRAHLLGQTINTLPFNKDRLRKQYARLKKEGMLS